MARAKRAVQDEMKDAFRPMLRKNLADQLAQRIKAMIINGLGFTQHPLYLSAQFFEGKALSRLFGEGVDASHFNDDALVRSLDVCYDYGTTRLLAEIVTEIAAEFFPPKRRDSAHLDTTSISLCGDYDLAESRMEGAL